MDAALTHSLIDAARTITQKTGGFWTDQLANRDQLLAYHQMGDEIWRQTEGELDAFVAMTGTAACCRGVSESLHQYNRKVHCVAVEPTESPVLSTGMSGAHKIEGVGAGFVVPLWDAAAVDDIMTVSTQEAITMCRQLALKDALFAGTSTGGNVSAAIKLGLQLGPAATIVTIQCDSGVKYLSTDVYSKTTH